MSKYVIVKTDDERGLIAWKRRTTGIFTGQLDLWTEKWTQAITFYYEQDAREAAKHFIGSSVMTELEFRNQKEEDGKDQKGKSIS